MNVLLVEKEKGSVDILVLEAIKRLHSLEVAKKYLKEAEHVVPKENELDLGPVPG